MRNVLDFLAAEIDGPGIEGDGEVGVWLVTDISGGSTPIFAINAEAHKFSEWGADVKREMASMSDPDAQEALECVRSGGQ